MFDYGDDAVERAARHLQRPVSIDPALDGRIMRDIVALQPRGGAARVRALWRWIATPRLLPLSPLGGLAAAVALVAVIWLSRADSRSFGPAPAGSRSFQFVLVAPRASQVSLVGDFNDWDAARMPMRRAGASGPVWTTVIPLPPGRYRYAFLVDGASWLADPAAPADRDDEFGAPSSVVTVGGS